MNTSRKVYALILSLLALTAVASLITDNVFWRYVAAAGQGEMSGSEKVYLPVVVASLQDAKPLFSELIADTELTDEQQLILDTLISDPITVRLSLVQADVNLLKDAQAISLNIFGDTVVEVTTDRVELRSNDDFTWFGSNPSSGTIATIVVEANNAVGTVIHENSVYKLVPIGESVHANTQVNYGQLDDEHPPEYVEMERGSRNKRNSSFLAAVEQIRLLVVYTPESTKQVATMDALVRLAVEETIQSFRNSGITKQVVLAHRTMIDYVETGNIYLDLDRLNAPNDGFMDSVHNLRAVHDADIVLLITSSKYEYCGLASDIGASYATAFAIVKQNCATGNYSFGHEMGHLLGARHNPEVDKNDEPYPYGHGYRHGWDIDPWKRWRTIMSYDCPLIPCVRLPYWSNPDVVYHGDPMGTEARHNNARVLNFGSSTPPSTTPNPTSVSPPTATPKPPTATSIPAPPELVNPSFEIGRREPWTFLNYNNACNWMVYNWPNVAKDGQYLLATNENGNNPDCSGFYQDVNRSPHPGGTYRFAIWARSAGGPRRGQIALWALGGQREVAFVDFSGIGTSWQCVETSLTVQRSGHSSLRAEIYLYSDDSVDYYFDKASLTMNTGPLCPPTAPPTLTATPQPPTATYTPRPQTVTHTPTSTVSPPPTLIPTPAIPAPILVYEGFHGGVHNLSVVNWESFPEDMFESAPDLPPCGLNTNSSRTWVNIYSSTGNRIYGFCAFDSADDLTKIWFSVSAGEAPPPAVYVILSDRRTGVSYRSNDVEIR